MNSIQQILPSPDGYLWLGTYDGLVRFDGVQFSVFKVSNTPELVSNRVSTLLQTRDGSLWAATLPTGLVRYRDRSFTRFLPDGEIAGASRQLCEAPDGTLWMVAGRYLCRVQGERVVRVAHLPFESTPQDLEVGDDGTIWVGSRADGLFRLEGEDLRSVPLPAPGGTTVLHLERGPRPDELWIGTERGLFLQANDRIRAQTPPGSPDAGVVTGLFHDPLDSTLWVGSDRGVRQLRVVHAGATAGTEVLARHETPFDPSQIGFLALRSGEAGWFAAGKTLYRDGVAVHRPGSDIQALAADREGSVWVGTSRGGLIRVTPAELAVVDDSDPLHALNALVVAEDGTGVIWVGSLGRGLFRIEDDRPIPVLDPPHVVRSLHFDPDGSAWIGHQNGLSRYRSGRLEPVAPDTLRNIVSCIFRDTSGALWIGGGDGLFQLRGSELRRVGARERIRPFQVQTAFEDPDGTLWFGSNGGGILWSRRDEWHSLTTAEGLSSDLVRAVYRDPEGILWAGTEGGGLNRIAFAGDATTANARISVIRESDGLLDDVIHRILADGDGHLWLTTNHGLYATTVEKLNAFAARTVTRVSGTIYNERDGMRDREANGGGHPAGIRARDGRFWIPTQNGVVVVDPDEARAPVPPPPVVIEAIRAAGAAHPIHGDRARLPSGDRDFEIHYAGLSLTAPENVRFRYRLEGRGSDWVDVGTRRTAYFTNVPPGRYTFRVQAGSIEGEWSDTGAALVVTVPHRLHERLDVQLLGAALVLLGGFWSYRLRLRSFEARQRELARLVDIRTAELVREKEATEASRRLAETQRAAAEDARAVVEAQALELRELDDAKSRFFADVSHEFRTPLTLTIGPLEDLLKGRDGELPPRLRGRLEGVLRNSRRILHMVNEILDLARIGARRFRVQAREITVASYLLDVSRAVQPLAESRGVQFRLDMADPGTRIHLDPELMDRVFSNLLSNAFKFTPEGGTVTLALRRAPNEDPGGVTIEVSDTGPGIPPDELPFIFDRFYRTRDAQLKRRPGTGLGLSVAREIVELHGGSIEVESRDGGGTTFRVKLLGGQSHLKPEQRADDDVVVRNGAAIQILDPEPDAAPRGPGPAAEEEPPREDEGPTVLVVDDYPEIRSLMAEHLRSAYRVIEAANGAEALETARRLIPDLIISDVMMPVMDGHELCAAVKQDPELDFIPVILLTALASSDNRIEGLELGADDYVAKPFVMSELKARVANLIASRKRWRERFTAPPPPPTQPPAPAGLDPLDAAFLDRVRDVVTARLAEEEFNVQALADALNTARSHLYRRLHELTGQSPLEFLRNARLERAAELLRAAEGSVGEVAYGVGFKSVSHFCRAFREKYGVTPSTWAGTVPSSTRR